MKLLCRQRNDRVCHGGTIGYVYLRVRMTVTMYHYTQVVPMVMDGGAMATMVIDEGIVISHL